MSGFDWKSVVKTVAPMLGTALGGPFGTMAGLAVAKCLGTDAAPVDPTNDAAMAAAIQGATPDQLLAIQKANEDFQVTMTTLGFKNEADLEAIAAGDRKSARDMATQNHDIWSPRILAAIIVSGFLFCVFYVLTGHAAGMKDPLISGILGTLIGYVSSKADQVYNYYFGSNAASKIKDQMLYNSTPVAK